MPSSCRLSQPPLCVAISQRTLGSEHHSAVHSLTSWYGVCCVLGKRGRHIVEQLKYGSLPTLGEWDLGFPLLKWGWRVGRWGQGSVEESVGSESCCGDSVPTASVCPGTLCPHGCQPSDGAVHQEASPGIACMGHRVSLCVLCCVCKRRCVCE